jgi:hypothetical protein
MIAEMPLVQTMKVLMVLEEVVAMGDANRRLTSLTKTSHQPHRYTHGLLYLAVPY